MKFQKIDSKYQIRMYKDEEILTTLHKFLKVENINTGYFSGIGGVDHITLGYYELASKSYHWQEFKGNLEVTSLLGNVTLLNSEPFVHAHVNISNESFQTFGGHLKEASVGVTLEIVLEKLEGQVIRELDQEIGLNLMELEKS